MNLKDLETGDLLLFDESPDSCCLGTLDGLIKLCTSSSYSHSAIVLRNPPWVSRPGIYLWESTYHGAPDPQDNLIKFGVQITPISRYINDYPGSVHIYVRKCRDPEIWTKDKLERIHSVVYCKSYDVLPQDWFEAWIQRDLFAPRTTRFFCSALVAYIMAKVGVIASDTNWTKVSPQQLSATERRSNIRWLTVYGVDALLETK